MIERSANIKCLDTVVMKSVLLAMLIVLLMLALPVSKGAALAVALPIVILCLIRPDIAYLLMLFALPWETFLRFSSGASVFPVSIAKAFGMLALLGWLIGVFLRKESVLWSKRYLYLLGFLAVCIVSIIGAKDRHQSTRDILRLVSIYAMFFLTVNIVKDTRCLQRVVIIVVISAMALSVFAIVQRFASPEYFSDATLGKAVAFVDTTEATSLREVTRSSGGTTHPDWLAIHLLFAAGMSLIGVLNQRDLKVRLFLVLALFTIVGGLVLSFSRTGGFGIVILLCLLVVFKVIRITPRVLLVGAVVLFLAVITIPKQYWQRVFAPSHLKESHNILMRIDLLKSGIRMFAAHPFLGVGVGNYEANGADYASYSWLGGADSHNLYIEILSETGVVGGTVFFLLLFVTLLDYERARRLSSHIRRDIFVCIASLEVIFITFCFCGLVLHITERKEFWLLMALAISAQRIIEAEATTHLIKVSNAKPN